MKPQKVPSCLAVFISTFVLYFVCLPIDQQTKAFNAEQVLYTPLKQDLPTNTFKKAAQTVLVGQHEQLAIAPLSNYSIVIAQVLPVERIVVILVVFGSVIGVILLRGFVRVGQYEVGIVYKKFGRQTNRLIALNERESGWRASTLSPGLHWCFPWLYKVRIEKAISIAPDQIGVVEAKDGEPLLPGRIFGRIVECNAFQDAQAFLEKGGQRGVQLGILSPGIYRINTKIFTVEVGEMIRIHANQIGIVEAKDGNPLRSSQNFGRVVECNDFQDAQAFLEKGGQRGRQLAILTAGTYQINTKLFSVQRVAVTEIEIGEVGVVEAKDGAPLLPGINFGRVVECNDFQDAQAFLEEGGQRGKQLAILAAGIYQINTALFQVHNVSIVKVPVGEIALVIAQDGAPLPDERILGRVVECNDFQDAQAFLEKGGQRGRQLATLVSGNYSINTELFTVITSANATQYGINSKALQVCRVAPDRIGVITVHDGAPIPANKIAGPPIKGHNNFQNGQAFINHGGWRGLQEEILPEGTWSLNPWFVSVEQVPLTVVNPGTVGVVISFTGKEPEISVSDSLVKHQYQLVDQGYKGIEKTPLPPGRYPINTKVRRVEIVPTHELALEWTNRRKPSTNFDANLHSLFLRSRDGFSFAIEITQVISIVAEDAPKLLSRIGFSEIEEVEPVLESFPNVMRYRSISNLVTRVLVPMIENLFRNSAQNYEILDFLEHRVEIQRDSEEHIKFALDAYGVRSVGTFINEVNLPDELEQLIRARSLAEETRKTYQAKQLLEEEIQDFFIVAQIKKLRIEAEAKGSELEKLFLLTQQFLSQVGAKIQQETEKSLTIFSVQGRLRDYLPIPVSVITGQPTAQDVTDIVQQETLSRTKADSAVSSRAPVGIVIYGEPPETTLFKMKMTEVRLCEHFILIPIHRAAIEQAIVEDEKSPLQGAASKALLASFVDLYLPGADLFNDRNAIGDTLAFFGRAELQYRLEEELPRNQGIGVFGLRKSGKTSLLIQLGFALRRHPVIQIDLQTYGGKLHYGAEIFNRILEQLSKLISEKHSGFNQVIQTFEPNHPASELTTDFIKQIGNFAEISSEVGYELPILIFLDEVERILPTEVDSRERVEEFNAFFGVLRALSQEQRQVSLLIADVHPDCNRINQWNQKAVPTNPVFNFFKEYFLPPFPCEETVRMITEIGKMMGLDFDEKTLISIHERSGGHPFLARQLASLLYEKNRKGGEAIEWLAVEKYIKKPFSYSGILKDYFGQNIWNDLKKRNFNSAVAVLSIISCNEKVNRKISERSLLDCLRNGFTEGECLDALLWLEKVGLLSREETETDVLYQMQVPLLSLWIQMHMTEDEIFQWQIS